MLYPYTLDESEYGLYSACDECERPVYEDWSIDCDCDDWSE